MQNALDQFAHEVRKKRHKLGMTQKQFAEQMHMSARTIIELENCKSNPKAETILLIAKQLNINLDEILFPEADSDTVPKAVIDFFAGKSTSEIRKYIALCQQADQFKEDN